MSEPIQMPASALAAARIAPVRPEPPIEPAKRPQTDNRNSNEQRDGERRPAPASAEIGRHLTVTRDEDLNSFVYRSIDDDTGEVMWQWPAEEMLRRAHHLRALEERMRDEAHAVDESA